MGNVQSSGTPGGYSLPGVPWTCFFVPETGVAFHGAYWHNNFGAQMSHGCVNMRPADAKWLFRWSTPVWEVPVKSAWPGIGVGAAPGCGFTDDQNAFRQPGFRFAGRHSPSGWRPGEAGRSTLLRRPGRRFLVGHRGALQRWDRGPANGEWHT